MEVVAECGGGVAVDGELERRGVDVGVAVAVAADPRPGPQERPGEQVAVGPAGLQRLAHRVVEVGHDLEQRQVVVLQPLGDLVGQAQALESQQGGLPEGQHRPPQRTVPRGPLARIQVGAVAPVDELDDPPLDLEHRLPPHLGGVGGHHGAHEGVPERLLDRASVHRQGVDPGEGGGDGPGRRGEAGEPVATGAPVLVEVLGQVRQQGEVAERPHDVQGIAVVERPEVGDQRVGVAALAAQAQSLDPSPLDEAEDGLARLVADDVTEHAPEQPDVGAELVVRVGRRRVLRDGGTPTRGDVDHAGSIPGRGRDRNRGRPPFSRGSRSPPRPGREWPPGDARS